MFPDYNIHALWQFARSIVLAVLGAYLVIAMLITMLQSRLVYYPSRKLSATPDVYGLAYEDVTFESGDGIRLSGWFVPAPEERGAILFCHGNAGNISHRMESIKIFHDLGLSTFIFDYRGYGASEGKPSESGTYKDVEAAWRYLVEKRSVPPDRIVIFGRSLGGAIAAWLARKHPPKACILESTFTSAPDLGAQIYPWLPVRFVARFKYATITYLQGITCPILVVHSPDDDIIPYSHGRALFEAAHEPKEFLAIRGSHNDGFLAAGHAYISGLDSFLARNGVK